jgi:hypothetical protein
MTKRFAECLSIRKFFLVRGVLENTNTIEKKIDGISTFQEGKH